MRQATERRRTRELAKEMRQKEIDDVVLAAAVAAVVDDSAVAVERAYAAHRSLVSSSRYR